MIVWQLPCESRSSPGINQNPGTFRKVPGNLSEKSISVSCKTPFIGVASVREVCARVSCRSHALPSRGVGKAVAGREPCVRLRETAPAWNESALFQQQRGATLPERIPRRDGLIAGRLKDSPSSADPARIIQGPVQSSAQPS